MMGDPPLNRGLHFHRFGDCCRLTNKINLQLIKIKTKGYEKAYHLY